MSTTPDDNLQPEEIILPEQLNSENFSTPEGQIALNKFLTDPATRAAAIKAISLVPDANKEFRDRQKKLGLPYYKQGYAEEVLREIFDPMLADGEPRCLLKKDYKRWSISTIAQKIRQAFEFAVDNMDTPDKKYAVLKKRISICTEKQRVVIRFNYDSEPLKVHIYREQSSYEDVFLALEEIVEKGEFDCKYKIPVDDSFLPFSLDEEEVNKLKEYCSKFPFIIASVGSEEVAIIKLGKPLAANEGEPK